MPKEKSEQKGDEAYNYAISIDEINESLRRHGVKFFPFYPDLVTVKRIAPMFSFSSITICVLRKTMYYQEHYAIYRYR